MSAMDFALAMAVIMATYAITVALFLAIVGRA